jgi:isocitrate dehydrogenase (NAD+)
VRSRYQDIDLVIVRENTEDLYAGIEFEKGDPNIVKLSQLVEASGQKTFRPDAGISIKAISVTGTERISRSPSPTRARTSAARSAPSPRPIS